ncbi:MAG: protein-L-isoaspartate(D-aspartate) O-methyltransferase [Candidatus Aenigmatarchaeota archaeon]
MVFEEENENLIEYIKSLGYLKTKKIEEALNKLPRHMFVPEIIGSLAYRDTPLYIGYRQTISQPSVVVIMTEALEVEEGQKILEIGTGSGWQAAILSYLVGDEGFVYSMEIVKELAKLAKENIKKFEIENIKIFVKDGSNGLEEKAPFDRIVVTAGAPSIPNPLVKQLKTGGIMVIPVGNLYLQKMYVVKKTNKGIEKKPIGNFDFVPLVGKHGFKKTV